MIAQGFRHSVPLPSMLAHSIAAKLPLSWVLHTLGCLLAYAGFFINVIIDYPYLSLSQNGILLCSHLGVSQSSVS